MATRISLPALDVAGSPVADAPVSARLHYMANMRGITILMVIASHCYGLAWSGTAEDWFPHDPVLSFISGATPVFVFISGFFFHHVFGRAFSYPAFIRKKAGALLPPYLFITAVLVLAERAMHIAAFRYGTLTDPGTQFVMAAMTGASGPAMWYLPFLFDIFLLSPLFLLFMRAPVRAQAAVLLGLFVIGLLVDRSFFNRFANLGHFVFFYALGIWCSLHRQRFERLVQRPEAIAASLGAIVLLGIAQYEFGLAQAAHLPLPWSPEKFVYVRKLALILLMAGVLLRFGQAPLPGLITVADWSFALFFVHQIALLALRPLAASGCIRPGFGALLIFATLATLISLALIWLARQSLGRRSRYFVGA
jgi:probable poly-beta-1,6-N-acetyl-D-glucosamine export protein